MNRSTGLFWGFIVLLASASIHFGIGAYTQQIAIRGQDGKIENGSIVHLVRVVDGDTLLVAEEGQKPAHVRILGIKSFDAKIEKDVVSPYAKAAFETLERMLGNKPLRIMLQNGAKDRFGRYVGTIYADDHDVGLSMIEQGLVMAYTVYPFAAMTVYVQAQDGAKKMRRGLWASSDASERAAALIKEWQRQNR